MSPPPPKASSSSPAKQRYNKTIYNQLWMRSPNKRQHQDDYDMAHPDEAAERLAAKTEEDNAELYKMWRVRHTVLQLCHDRGYLITQDELDETFEQFKKLNKGALPDRADITVLCTHHNNIKDKMFVYFPEEPKIGIKIVQNYVTEMVDREVNRAIIVIREGLTPSAKQAMKDVAPEYIMESFLESEMLINITEHELVPTHILLTTEEKEELFARYRLKESQLMKMLTTDPVARYYGFKRGQVVKIVRNSDTAGRYVTHRLVV